MTAINYLGNSRSAATLPALLQCLDDPNTSVSFAAARALGMIKQKPGIVVPALVRALRRASFTPAWNQPDLRSAVASALVGFGTNADVAVPELLLHLSRANENDPILYLLITTLRSVSAQPDAIVPTLTTYLQSTNDNLRQYAASSLASFGPRAQSALKSLTNALQFPDTRGVVADAIRRISSDASTNATPQ